MRPPTANTASGIDARAVDQFAADVRYYIGLEPRQLPSHYFYDELGSALFEAICRLPWYGITRAESRLLTAYGDDVFRSAGPVSSIVELGPGSGEKLRLLLEAGEVGRGALNVHLVDVSQAALEMAAQRV